MRKIILFIIPFILAIILFAGVVVVVNQKTGKGALQVTSSPQSEVYLNGKLVGATPLCKCENKDMVSVGEYSLRLVPKDKSLNPFEEKVMINKSTLTVVDRTFGEGQSASVITLTPISDKNSSEIIVITSPPGADVYLDNNLSGKSSFALKNVTASDHELKLSKEGYLDKTLRIKTTDGFMLKTIVYLGTNIDSSAPILPRAESLPSPTVSPTKVLILDTPTGFLRVRSSSSVSTSEIGRVSPGETFDLLEETEGWFKIKLVNGLEGWISSQYAQKQ